MYFNNVPQRLYFLGLELRLQLVRPPGLLVYFLGLFLSPTDGLIFMEFHDMDTSSNWLDCFMPD